MNNNYVRCYSNQGVAAEIARQIGQIDPVYAQMIAQQVYRPIRSVTTASGAIVSSVDRIQQYTRVFDDNLHEAIQELCEFLNENCKEIFPQWAEEHEEWLNDKRRKN